MNRLSCSANKAGRVDVVGMVVTLFILAVIVAVVFPMFARVHIGGHPITCQSNTFRIGRALKMYLFEWHDTYPSNRVLLRNGKLGLVAAHVKLTPAGLVDKTTNQAARFRYGVNWVEALYPYVEAISSRDSASAWVCPQSAELRNPDTSNTAAVSYAFNRNLIERPEGIILRSDNLMMVREMDRLVDSELRPTNYSCGRSDVPPDSPFLTGRDSRIGSTTPKIHNMGSNVLFADTHVKYFPTELFPDQRRITAKRCWDANDRQWYNCVDPADPHKNKTIAITP